MAKARSRIAARKIKDKWKAKAWYDIHAPVHFNNAKIAETLADDPEKLKGRVAETTLQELTGDFKQMHVKLAFKVDEVDGTTAKTHFVGHSLTSDYLRRMTRRNHSKIDAVVDALTKDGGKVRVKPFAVSDRRTQTTQAQALRAIMHQEVIGAASEVTLNRFIRDVIDGKLASRIYKACKPIYPVRRVEINKTEVRRLAQIEIEEDWAAEFAEPEPEPEVDAEVPAEGDDAEAGGAGDDSDGDDGDAAGDAAGDDAGAADAPAEEAPEAEEPAVAEADAAAPDADAAEEVTAEAKE